MLQSWKSHIHWISFYYFHTFISLLRVQIWYGLSYLQVFPSMGYFVFILWKAILQMVLSQSKLKKKHDKILWMRKTTLVIVIILEIYLNALFTVVNCRYFNFLCIICSNIIPFKEVHWKNRNQINLLLIKAVIWQ